ncbi:Disease resistance protein [Sesamum alatum]|uniref:Disease resistance protein n=1 Tax=Sesamum alatum TaxID=300844 RepID=A0AAE2CAA4_9LAMI|nr:Disease resistance protein [Sesamum alatum]
MEVLAAVIGSVLAEPCRAIFTFVRAKIRNPLRFSANLRALDKEMEDLIQRRNQLREHLALAATAGIQAPSQVRNWLGQVNRLEDQVRYLKDYLAFRAGNSACSFCLRCSKLSDRVARWLGEARKLKSEGEFPESMAGPDPSIVKSEYIPAPSIEDQATASRNMAKVMDLLSCKEVQRIGIWGMGGVGKTTLVKNINNKLTSPSPVSDSFNIVIWITVSNKTHETESELKKVQKLIADRLKLMLPEESMETRSSKLHARLMMEKTFLLILDDVWDSIDLDLVGIPTPELHKGGKIILTTRFSYVCLQMTEVTLKIEVLDEEESWRLFCKSAGEVATLGEVEPLARAVTKECAGLPLAIVVVGASLKGKRMVELWKDALNALRRSEPLIRGRIEDKVYNPIKWSYDVLPDECIKYCFLFCCLFPEDFPIIVEELVRYWLAEGLLDECHNIEEVMDRGMTVIEILKDSSLLEQDHWSNVKIHDVIRDVSVWISSSLQIECKSLVRSGIGLHQIREDELSSKFYKRVSFIDNQIKELPNAVNECPTVSTLLLQWNKELEEIPDQFLAAFTSLKILDLSGCYLIKPCKTPSACLQQHKSCHTTRSLEYLDMRGNKQLKFIGEMGEISYLFKEIFSIDRLITLFIDLDSSACTLETTNTLLNRMLNFKKFELSIGSNRSVSVVDRERSKTVFFLNIHLWGERMEWLFKNSTSLYFQGCEGLDTMFEKLVANSDEAGSFDTVKLLSISTSTGGFGVRSNANFDMLPNLEDIYLRKLTHLSCISDLVLPLGLKFPMLRGIVVEGCPELKYLISLGTTILSLVKLERITLYSCEQAEELFKFDQNPGQGPILFPNLKEIMLSDCLALRFLSEQNVACPGLEVVSVQNCPLLKKLPLTDQNVGTIKQIRGEQEWWDQLQWDNDHIKKQFTTLFYAFFDAEVLHHC